MKALLLILLLSARFSLASDFYEKVSDLLNATNCESSTEKLKALCTNKNMGLMNQSDLKSISKNQFYNDLSNLEIERLQCSQTKAASLEKTENILEIKNKVVEITPVLIKIQKDIDHQISKNQILNGQIPKSMPPKPGTAEYQRKTEYDDRNNEIKSLMAMKEMLISQIPFSESKPIQDLITDSIKKNGEITTADITSQIKDLKKSLNNSVSEITATKNSAGQFELSTDQKISLGTDDFLISQMLNNNPNNAIEIKSLQCSSEKIKKGQTLSNVAVTVASFVIPVGFASAGRAAFLMGSPLWAQRLSTVSRVAGASFGLVGNIQGFQNVVKACTKHISAKVISGNPSATNQCDYSSQTLVSDFNTSSCIINAALQILPNAGVFLTKKISDRNSLLTKYISDIKALPSLKKLSISEKENFLQTASTMTDLQRKASTSILTERTLTPLQKTTLIEVHQMAPGKGYFELTPKELEAKLIKLRSAGFYAEESDLILRSGLAGQMAKATQKIKTVLDAVSTMPDSANKSRLLAELNSNSVKPNIEKSTELFQKSTEQYLDQIKNQNSAPSARDYSDLEYVSARWAAQAKNPNDSAKATKIYIDAIEKRFRTDKPQGQGSNVQDYLLMLKNDPGLGLHKDASLWKIDTIKKHLNTKGWNLK